MKCLIILLVTTWSPQFKIGDVGSGITESGCRLEWYSSSPRAWSMVNLWVKLRVEEVHVKPPSHAGDGTTEPMLAGAWCRCWVVLEMALLHWCWSWRDATVESCRRCSAEARLAMVWCRYRLMLELGCRADVGRGVMSLPRHDGDGTAEAILVVAWCHCLVMLTMTLVMWLWPWRDITIESYWWWWCWDNDGRDAVEVTLAVVVWCCCRLPC
jgi:hypothetical protein